MNVHDEHLSLVIDSFRRNMVASRSAWRVLVEDGGNLFLPRGQRLSAREYQHASSIFSGFSVAAPLVLERQ